MVTLGLLWGLALSPASASASSSEVPVFSGVDLVLLSGIPGDVESESTYRRQMVRLLELLETRGQAPRRAWILSDEAEGLEVPEFPWIVDTLPANRRTLHSLITTLTASKHPLVVLAWGHGGTIRDTPVLHVRGPRIEPGDLVELAKAIEAPSRWLLFFRHSGGFARTLRGPDREVLASENRTAYRSDPVALDRLLEVLAEPSTQAASAGLDRLGQHLTQRTLAWYDEQHLARQEDPTLWLGDSAPRILAKEVPDPADATVASTGGAAGEAVVTQGTGANPAPGGNGLAGDPPEASEETAPEVLAGLGWDGIARVDPADYPGADAVVLRRTWRYTLGDNPAYVEERDEFIQILRPGGTRRGDVDFGYNPPGETLTLVDGEVRQPDGRLVRVAEEDVRDASSDTLAGYRGATYKLINLPEVRVGSVLRLHTRREWKRFPLPHVPLQVPLVDTDPVRQLDIRVEVGRDAAFHWRLHGGPEVEPTVVERPYGREHGWRFTDLEAWPDEPLASPLAAPRLQVSTFPSWAEFAEWYRRLVRQADTITPEIAAKAAELAAGKEDPHEVVRAIYNWVTRLRYVAIPLGVNSHRPHAASRVLDNLYGDCKDKANLFNTLLASLDIEADLVLVPRFSQAHEATPGLGFNHAISRVRLGDSVIWADTTDEVARFGLLPPGDPGRRVLVVADGVDSLEALPQPQSRDHRLELQGRVELAADGASHPTTLDAQAWGYADYALRLATQGAATPLLRSQLAPVHGLFSLESQRSTDPGALAEDFRWHGVGSLAGITGRLDPASPTARWVQAPLWLPGEWEAALHQRRTPLFLNRGYPLELHQTLDLVLPAAARNLAAPEPVEGGAGPITWRLAWEPLPSGSSPGWRVRFDLVLATGELDADTTPIFQQQVRLVREVLSRGARYEL